MNDTCSDMMMMMIIIIIIIIKYIYFAQFGLIPFYVRVSTMTAI